MTLTLQLFKNSNDTQEKLRLNLHSLSVSELLKYTGVSVHALSVLETFMKGEVNIFNHPKEQS
jgi:ABC-type transport system involved in cytochrome bd biosynthesis fused ATPase/permease subunit